MHRPSSCNTSHLQTALQPQHEELHLIIRITPINLFIVCFVLTWQSLMFSSQSISILDGFDHLRNLTDVNGKKVNANHPVWLLQLVHLYDATWVKLLKVVLIHTFVALDYKSWCLYDLPNNDTDTWNYLHAQNMLIRQKPLVGKEQVEVVQYVGTDGSALMA